MTAGWQAEDTTPAAVEAAVRRLELECHAADPGFAPARALNVVAVTDASDRSTISERLSGVGRYHGSRVIVCAIEPGRRRIAARVAMTRASEARTVATVELTIGEDHVDGLVSIVDPLVITDVATVAWAPHGHDAATDALAGLAQVVLLDSDAALIDPEVAGRPQNGSAAALARAAAVSARAYVVDLAWLRCTPWRERLAAAFDPPARRDELARLAKVSVRHREGSAASGLLLLGWLCARLGWDPEPLTRDGTVRHMQQRGLTPLLRLEAIEAMDVPGLEGVEVTADDGTSLALERAPGGLRARRRDRAGDTRTWTVLGASRGEGGILGEGIRQALLRDPAHGPALQAAARLAA